MKGQVSLEYLMLFAISSIMIFLSLSALLGIKSSSESLLHAYSFRNAALSLARDISEVCVLGSGNQRYSALSNISLETAYTEDGWLIRFASANSSIVKKIPCAVESADQLDGQMAIINEDGVVKITER